MLFKLFEINFCYFTDFFALAKCDSPRFLYTVLICNRVLKDVYFRGCKGKQSKDKRNYAKHGNRRPWRFADYPFIVKESCFINIRYCGANKVNSDI